jgi:polysaccharide export outer membrane protein
MRELEASRRVEEMNEKIIASALFSRRDFYRDYKIGPEDLLEISVFEEEKLNKTVRVSSQGNVSLPLMGVMRVKGLTSNEVEKEIRDLLAEKYLNDPHVSVFIKEYRNQRISVMGAVEKPGTFDVTGQKTILDILALAGGLKEDAGQLLFVIRRPPVEDEAGKEKKDSDDQMPRTFIIDLDGLLVRGELAFNMPLLHGDVINIPLSGKIFVGGEVKSPGGFPLRGKKLTISQAIALAGGLKGEAAGSEARIFRYSEKGIGKEVILANIYDIQKGKAEDLYLRENDIVIVPKSATKMVLKEVWEFIKGHIGALSYALY